MADHRDCLLGIDLRVCVSRIHVSQDKNVDLDPDRTCTSSMYVMIYGQIKEEFQCSTLVVTLGLSTYVFGLGKSKSESKVSTDRKLKERFRRRTAAARPAVRVLWSTNHLHCFFCSFPSLVDSLCCGAQHRDHDHCPVLCRAGRQCLSERGRRHGWRHVPQTGTGGADDVLHGKPVRWARDWAIVCLMS